MQTDALPKPPSLRFALVLSAFTTSVEAVWFANGPTAVASEILFVGDSVTYMSSDQLSQETGSEDPIVLARGGFSSTDMLPLFEEAVARREAEGREHLRQVAILIGYNDLHQRQPDHQAIERFMKAADHYDCAVWLELPPVPSASWRLTGGTAD